MQTKTTFRLLILLLAFICGLDTLPAQNHATNTELNQQYDVWDSIYDEAGLKLNYHLEDDPFPTAGAPHALVGKNLHFELTDYSMEVTITGQNRISWSITEGPERRSGQGPAAIILLSPSHCIISFQEETAKIYSCYIDLKAGNAQITLGSTAGEVSTSTALVRTGNGTTGTY